MLYASNFDGDDDRLPYKSGKSMSAERRAYTTLASVCWYWRQTLTGWPQSPTMSVGQASAEAAHSA